MGQYSGPVDLITPDDQVIHVPLAILESQAPSYTRTGSWGGDLRTSMDGGDPFFPLMMQHGVRLRIDDRVGVILIKSCTSGGAVAQVEGSGDPPF